MSDTLVVILAGGEGSRFKPFVTDKTLFPFLGKPFLQHLLELVEKAGFENVLVATNKNNQSWIDTYNSSLKIETVMQENPLGMADAMLALEKQINGRSILVLNAVDLVGLDLFKTILEKIPGSESIVVGKEVSEYVPAGYLQTEGEKVTSIVEKPGPGNEPSNLINLVFHYFKNAGLFFKELHQVESDNDDRYEIALDSLMKQIEVSYISYDGPWAKLKYPHFVLNMIEILLGQIEDQYIHPEAEVSDHAVIEGPVFIDKHAKIYEYAVIKGPAYVGSKTIIGNHSLVFQSMIEAESVIGAHSEVSRSYIGPETWLHHNYVGDSVLEGDTNPSYGTCFSNMRLDKKPVYVELPTGKVQTNRVKLGSLVAKGLFSGINTCFMPGSVIEANARILPQSVVKGLIKNDS